MPRIAPVVADTTGRLNQATVKKLHKRIVRLQKKFPQLVMQVVMHRFSAEHPFSMNAFWMFNAGAFAGEMKRGNENFALLLLVDPDRKESAIVPGYGLEEALEQKALEHLLHMSSPAFQGADWDLGFEVIFEGLEQLLNTVTVAEASGGMGAGEY